MVGNRGEGPGLEKEGNRSVRKQAGSFKGFTSRDLGRLRSTLPHISPPS